MPELAERAPMRDVFTHPFRAQQGYEEWGLQAGNMATRQVEVLQGAVTAGTISEGEADIYRQSAFEVIRAFNEFGYNSRVLDTAIITVKDIRALMGEAVGAEKMGAIDEAPLAVRLSLLKTAKDAFMWGRTDDPHAETGLGEASEAAETPGHSVFFEDDINDFADRVGERVESAAIPVLKKKVGMLGRFALWRRDPSSKSGPKVKREYDLRAVVSGAAFAEARQLLKPKPAKD